MVESTPVTILLAEDDDGHARLVELALERGGFRNPFFRVVDGKAVFEFLDARERDAAAATPGPLLLVLDIKMPRMDGVEVLRRLKTDPTYSSIPVIMLTTTDDPREIEICYQLGCNVYITKPVEYEAFVEAVRRLGLFLQVVSFPRT